MRGLILGLAAVAGVLLAGPAESAFGATLSGGVRSGDRPVAGSTVTLYSGGTAGATELATTVSDQTGQFQVTYEDPGGVLYAISSGGKVGPRQAGGALRMMTMVRASGEPLASVQISEQTTVASAYALARFIDGATVSGPSPGLPNAAATVSNLVEPRTGKLSSVLASSPNGNATEALPTFNTLANVIASCARGGKARCRELLRAARPPGGARPDDTLEAVVDVAHYPSRRTGRLFRLQRVLYEPALESKPVAWTLALVYTDGGFDAPGRMAFDAAGNVWSNNNFQPPGSTGGNNLTVLSPTGEPILGSPITTGGLAGAGFGMAIDQNGNAWVANFGGSSISLFDSQGQALAATGYTNGMIDKPQGIAIDQQGNVWIPNFHGNSVTVYRGGDPEQAQPPIQGGGLERPFAIAIDGGGNAWVTDQSTSPAPGAVTKLDPSGTPSPSSPITGGGLRSPQGIAVDSHGNLWVANLLSHSVTEISNAGEVYKRSPIRVDSLRGPWGVAVDGDDNVWVAGFYGVTLTQLCGQDANCPPGKRTGDPISPRRTGFVSEGIQHLTAVQVDQSGNVWVANNWSTGSPLSHFVGGNGLVEFIGMAAPVKTPLIGPPQSP